MSKEKDQYVLKRREYRTEVVMEHFSGDEKSLFNTFSKWYPKSIQKQLKNDWKLLQKWKVISVGSDWNNKFDFELHRVEEDGKESKE
jgi:hypothetical protein|tara:strand:- start:1344 stop:1604 length:261 start_codon:yes stop_codon:yes gene_type:complete